MKLRGTFAGVVAVAALASGCSGSVNGTVSGISLAVQDSIFFVLKDDAGKTQAITVVMADKPNLCDQLKANREPKSATSLVFTLLNAKIDGVNSTLLAPDVGDYTVSTDTITATGLYARSVFSRTDANCTSSLTGAASSGKSGLVKVLAVKADSTGSLQANFDMSIGTQSDPLKGSVSARFCDVNKIQANPNCE